MQPVFVVLTKEGYCAGFQEALIRQANDLAELFGPEWGWVRSSFVVITLGRRFKPVLCRLVPVVMMALPPERLARSFIKSRSYMRIYRRVVSKAYAHSHRSAIKLVSNDSFWLS